MRHAERGLGVTTAGTRPAGLSCWEAAVSRNPEPLPILRVERPEFIDRRWDYRPGEHVTILGPTGWGKTYLGFQLLEPWCTPTAPGIILQMKARDDTVKKFAKKNRFRTVPMWPASPSVFNPRPAGYVVKPRFTHDPDIDNPTQYSAFRHAMVQAMKHGRGVKVFVDESADMCDIGLEKQMNHMLRQARSLKAGFWSATQRPFNAPQMAYGGANHLFIGNDPDKRSRDRYSEISGIDPKIIVGATLGLSHHEWLYIRRTRDNSPTVMCIIGA